MDKSNAKSMDSKEGAEDNKKVDSTETPVTTGNDSIGGDAGCGD
jgi:hypothetical protein